MEACSNENLEFIPMAVDNWGIWGQLSQNILTRVARHLAIATGKTMAEVRHNIIIDLNNSLAVANANMLANRISIPTI